MDFAPVIVTAPEADPVSTADVKAHLRISGSDDDDLIATLIDAAVAHFDGWRGALGRCLVAQTWRQDYAAWPSDGVLRLPFPDVSAVGWVKYYNSSNVQTTVSASDYELLADALGSYVQFGAGWSAPSLYDRAAPVSVQFTAGFGANAADVPAPIRAAITLVTSRLYATAKKDMMVDREAVEGVGSRSWGSTLDVATATDRLVDMMVQPYRRIGV